MSAEAKAAILTLLARRGAGKTICPSEAARALAAARGAPDSWREDMAAVHKAARLLAREGRVAIRQGGAAIEEAVGAYRIGAGATE